MRRFMLSAAFVCSALTALAASVAAQTWPYDHIHLNVPDPAAASAWYVKYFGARPNPEGPDRLMLGSTRLLFIKKADAKPSAGSAVDHIGFSFADLDAKMKEFQAAGIKVVTPVRDVQGLFKLGFIEDPWGTRIEVVQDSDKLGLHHIHLRAPDTDAALAWYKQKFGGETAKLKNRIDGVTYSGVWLLFQKGDATPSEGHAIDHIGWRTTDLAGKATEYKGAGVKFTTEPRP